MESPEVMEKVLVEALWKKRWHESVQLWLITVWWK